MANKQRQAQRQAFVRKLEAHPADLEDEAAVAAKAKEEADKIIEDTDDLLDDIDKLLQGNELNAKEYQQRGGE